MTDTRLAALEAVAKKARDWHDWEAEQPSDDHPRYGLWNEVSMALAALDALPAPTPGETVTLEAWEDPTDGDVRQPRPGSEYARSLMREGWRRLGTVTLAVTP